MDCYKFIESNNFRWNVKRKMMIFNIWFPDRFKFQKKSTCTLPVLWAVEMDIDAYC